MKYFRKIGSGFNVAPAVEELQRLGIVGHDDGVGVVPLYQHPALLGVGYQNSHYTAAHAVFGEAVAALGSPAVYAAILRVLPPKSRIPKHSDRLTATSPKRYHLALQADEQSRFYIRDERARFSSGELWRVDLLNRPHGVVNDSHRERIMLMVDVFDGTEGGGRPDDATVTGIRERLRRDMGADWERLARVAEWARTLS